MNRASPSSPGRATTVEPVAGAVASRLGAATSVVGISLVTLIALGVIVLVSVALHMSGLVGDLPYAPDIDEPTFMGAAVGMLARHSLNPQWFGHPGSTVIYPSAALIELWYLAAKHLPPFAHPMPGISRELAVDPMPFYVIGRLVSAAFGVGTVIVTALLGRKILGDLGGLLAAAFLPATVIVVRYGQIMRTDTAGVFFAVLALWLLVRAMELGRRRDWVFVAIAIGLAISSRYVFATLIAPYLVAAACTVWSTRQRTVAAGSWARAILTPFAALFIVPLTFALTSPFVLLKVRQFPVDASVHPGADGLSPIGNLLWYIGTITPNTFGWAIVAVATVGVVALARSHPSATAVLVAYTGSYLVGVSASPLHWDRYIIPVVPSVGIFAAGGALAIGSAIAGGLMRIARRRPAGSSAWGLRGPRSARAWLAGVGATVIVLLLLTPLLSSSVASARQLSGPSTRVVATDWIAQNLPPDSRIAQELYTTYLKPSPGGVLQVFDLAERSLDQYRTDGYRYLITTSGIADRFSDPQRYPRQRAFYEDLALTGRLLASFEPGPDRPGAVIRVYALAPDSA